MFVFQGEAEQLSSAFTPNHSINMPIHSTVLYVYWFITFSKLAKCFPFFNSWTKNTKQTMWPSVKIPKTNPVTTVDSLYKYYVGNSPKTQGIVDVGYKTFHGFDLLLSSGSCLPLHGNYCNDIKGDSSDWTQDLQNTRLVH